MNADLLLAFGRVDPASLPIYKLTLDYDKNLKKMIAEGGYDFVDEDVPIQNFSIKGSGQQQVEAVLVYFGMDMSIEEILSRIAKLHLDPPNLETLLALGVAEPELQRERPIIALNPDWVGSVGNWFLACLDVHADGDRVLSLVRSNFDLGDYELFLALRRRVA